MYMYISKCCHQIQCYMDSQIVVALPQHLARGCIAQVHPVPARARAADCTVATTHHYTRCYTPFSWGQIGAFHGGPYSLHFESLQYLRSSVFSGRGHLSLCLQLYRAVCTSIGCSYSKRKWAWPVNHTPLLYIRMRVLNKQRFDIELLKYYIH